MARASTISALYISTIAGGMEAHAAMPGYVMKGSILVASVWYGDFRKLGWLHAIERIGL